MSLSVQQFCFIFALIHLQHKQDTISCVLCHKHNVCNDSLTVNNSIIVYNNQYAIQYQKYYFYNLKYIKSICIKFTKQNIYGINIDLVILTYMKVCILFLFIFQVLFTFFNKVNCKILFYKSCQPFFKKLVAEK